MSGGDGLLFRARKKRPVPESLGYVGEIAASDPRWIEAIWQLNDSVPVISSMALGFDGEYYNVNADEMAAACATACHADALVFLTDVPGVKGSDGEVMRWLSIDQIAEMAKNAIITGGMLPKLGACREALLNGVKRVRILPAEAAASLPDLCSSRVAHGTEVMVALRRILQLTKLEQIRAAEERLLLQTYEPESYRFLFAAKVLHLIDEQGDRAISTCSAASACTRSATGILRLKKLSDETKAAR